MRISDYRQDYHRNGIGGKGGFWATFAGTDEGRADRYVAHIWHQCRDGMGGCTDGCEQDEPNEAFVTTLDGLTDGTFPAFRSSDNILPDILPHYRRAYQAWIAPARA